MKRDMDLVREILLFVEERISHGDPQQVEIDGREEREVNYHVKLLHQADFLETISEDSQDGDTWFVVGLTWDGHEFLDAARSNTVWRKALAAFQIAGIGISKEVLLPLLINLGKQQVGDAF